MLDLYEEAWESLNLLDAITNWKDFAKIPGINLHPLHLMIGMLAIYAAKS